MKFFENDFAVSLKDWLDNINDIELLKHIIYIFILNISDQFSMTFEINHFLPTLQKIEKFLKEEKMTIADLTPYEFDCLVQFVEGDYSDMLIRIFCNTIKTKNDEFQDVIIDTIRELHKKNY